MLDQVNHLHKELAELVNRHTDREGPQSTWISSLHFSRYSAPHHFTGTGAPSLLPRLSLERSKPAISTMRLQPFRLSCQMKKLSSWRLPTPHVST